jgi:hypothetical protein
MSRPESAQGRRCPRCRLSLDASLAAAPVASPPGDIFEAGTEVGLSSLATKGEAIGRKSTWRHLGWLVALGVALVLAARPERTPEHSREAARLNRAEVRGCDSPAACHVDLVATDADDPGPETDRTPDLALRRVEDAPAPVPAESTQGEPSGVTVVALAEPDPPSTTQPEPMPPPQPKVFEPDRESGSRRIRVQTESGKAVVARIHGIDGNSVSALLPDGQLGFPQILVDTDEPFRPATFDEMRQELITGPFAGFHVIQTAHYLVLFQSSMPFAQNSAKLLEELYQGLIEVMKKKEIPIHEPEFPLVAVIFRTEADFRAHKRVDRDVQAYYEIYTNRIYFYQASERDKDAPEVAALRKPQTVAHEGTHQILQNIGVQPRLGAWPVWLVEGLAEYCAAPVPTKNGVGWRHLGAVNSLHMATIRDLEDPLSIQVMGTNRSRIGRDPRMPLVEYLVTRTELTPTDYALAWALTHFLAMKRGPDFVTFLKAMAQLPPMKHVTPEEHLAMFRSAFGADLAKMDKMVATYLANLKNYEKHPFYAVMFEQRVGAGMLKRAALVSQSPSIIRQWLDTVSSADGAPPTWEALPHSTRARALLTAQQWMQNH